MIHAAIVHENDAPDVADTDSTDKLPAPYDLKPQSTRLRLPPMSQVSNHIFIHCNERLSTMSIPRYEHTRKNTEPTTDPGNLNILRPLQLPSPKNSLLQFRKHAPRARFLQYSIVPKSWSWGLQPRRQKNSMHINSERLHRPTRPTPHSRDRETNLPRSLTRSLERYQYCKKTESETVWTTEFNFIVQDETGKVNIVAWDDVASDLYEPINIGDCYRVTMFRVKEANAAHKQSESECELTLSKVK